VQYHFGNRSGLLRAIVERHMSVIDLERHALLDQADPVDDPPSPEQIRSSMARCPPRFPHRQVLPGRAQTGLDPGSSMAEHPAWRAPRMAAVRALPPRARTPEPDHSFLPGPSPTRHRDDHLDLRPTTPRHLRLEPDDVLVGVDGPASPATARRRSPSTDPTPQATDDRRRPPLPDDPLRWRSVPARCDQLPERDPPVSTLIREAGSCGRRFDSLWAPNTTPTAITLAA
jgi:AcrR family transcriptional regulator